jgi:hypothetical protein
MFFKESSAQKFAGELKGRPAFIRHKPSSPRGLNSAPRGSAERLAFAKMITARAQLGSALVINREFESVVRGEELRNLPQALRHRSGCQQRVVALPQVVVIHV